MAGYGSREQPACVADANRARAPQPPVRSRHPPSATRHPQLAAASMRGRRSRAAVSPRRARRRAFKFTLDLLRPMAAIGDVLRFFDRFRSTAGWALLIAVVNLVGIAYGFYYYRDQFALTPVWYWPFVPDSPLAVLWAQLALGAYWWRRRRGAGEGGAGSAALDSLAVVGNIQVGLWTVYVLLVYSEAFGTYTLNLNTILLAAHGAMALLALIFLHAQRQRHRLRPKAAWVGVGIAAAYYLVNDALDYFGPDFLGDGCGLRPMTVPCEPALEGLLTFVTFGLTFASLVFLAWVTHTKLDDRR